MTHRSLLVAVAAFAATVLLPACGGQPAATAVPNVSAFPVAHGQGRALLYVVTTGPLNVYTYPRGSLIGSVGSGGADLCSDRFGNVFVTTGTALTIAEYTHGAVIPKQRYRIRTTPVPAQSIQSPEASPSRHFTTTS